MDEFNHGVLEVIISVHFVDHLVILFVVENQLADGERAGSLQFEKIHLSTSQLNLDGSRMGYHLEDVLILERKQLLLQRDGIKVKDIMFDDQPTVSVLYLILPLFFVHYV